MPNRIDAKFKELRQNKKKALIVYLTCGYPSLSITERLVLELDNKGVDIIELGVPFSDPLADGPVIQKASQYVLEREKVNLPAVFSLVRRLRTKTQIPLCIMTYYNPVFSFGEDKFVRESSSSGVDGVIIPDLPPEEAKSLISLARKNNLSTIFFLSPTTTASRLGMVSDASSGFIYYVSLAGVTGIRKELSSDLAKNMRVIKAHTNKPVCIGFGISTARHVKDVFRIADGAIIGSAVIKVIQENIGKGVLVEKVAKFIENLRA